jgi:hypothetical protein
LGGRNNSLGKLHWNKSAAESLRTGLELALDFGYRSLLPLLSGLFFPDLHLGQNILDGDSTHSTLSVLKGHLWFLSSIMECIDEQSGILPPRPNSCRAIISIKADDGFAERACEMQGASIGRNHEVAPIKNGDETTKTTAQCFLGGMTTLLKHLLSQGGFSWGIRSDKYGVQSELFV